MSGSFKIEPTWFDILKNDPSIERNEESFTNCWLKILANETSLTRNILRNTSEDPIAQNSEIRDDILVSAYPLAMWICTSWWRLLYEPVSSSSSSHFLPVGWRMSHDLPAAASGYAWPIIRFISDEKNINIYSFNQNEEKTAIQPMTYLGASKKVVERKVVEKELSRFVSLVVEKLVDYSEDTELASLWAELQNEKENSEFAFYRIIEAILGFDPDEAPENIMKFFNNISKKFDYSTIYEIASFLNQVERTDQYSSLQNIVGLSKKGITGRLHIPSIKMGQDDTCFPWEYGRKLAHAVRQAIGIAPTKKISTDTLCNFLGIARQDFAKESPNDDFSLCSRNEDKLLINFRKESSMNYKSGRRFHLARLIGACVYDVQAQWFPISSSKTWLQKMQRAFAAEFLSPIESVRERLGTNFTDKQISRTAKYFAVSPRTIVHSLANHGDISEKDLVHAY